MADRSGSKYAGITLNWNYQHRTVDLSLPNYISTVLFKYDHPKPSKRQDSPHYCVSSSFGSNTQKSFPDDNSDFLTYLETKRIQQIVGSLLFYEREVDLTLHVALISVARQQSKATLQTKRSINQLLDYC